MRTMKTMKEILESHKLVRLATIDLEGKPCVRSVDYAVGDQEHVLYILTPKDSRKVGQIKNNPNIAVAIDHDCPTMDDLQKLKYLKGTGKAELIVSPEEREKAFGLLTKKLPFLKDLPGDPSDLVLIKIALEEVLVTDNTIEFGHTEPLSF
ncbi:MAG: pyridoxamine 5'-phosphate oxidase family protein [Thermodesulfobacteriota bacterium]|nr:pyridoxamine 5'-phosphate oxidase family protein [Thermodesulfobacteriota bacterium]